MFTTREEKKFICFFFGRIKINFFVNFLTPENEGKRKEKSLSKKNIFLIIINPRFLSDKVRNMEGKRCQVKEDGKGKNKRKLRRETTKKKRKMSSAIKIT
jgi:hypothetical protein